MQCFLSSKKQYQIYLHSMNIQRAINKNVPTANFFEADFKVRDRVRVYYQHIRQPQYQQLEVDGHLKVRGNGECQIFP